MAVSELPGNPNAVWTVRRHVEGKTHSHPYWAPILSRYLRCLSYFAFGSIMLEVFLLRKSGYHCHWPCWHDYNNLVMGSNRVIFNDLFWYVYIHFRNLKNKIDLIWLLSTDVWKFVRSSVYPHRCVDIKGKKNISYAFLENRNIHQNLVVFIGFLITISLTISLWHSM